MQQTAFATSPNPERARKVTPVVRIRMEPLLAETRNGKNKRYREQSLPTLALFFDYDSVLIPVGDPRDSFFSARGGTVIGRDRDFERKAQCLIEGFGAVELDCVPDLEVPLDSEAQYLLSVDGNAHSTCSFTAQALPQLEALGWRVDVEPDFPYQVVANDATWYASVQPEVDNGEDEPRDWFSIELGVDLEGKRIDLLPALLEILQANSSAETLNALFRVAAKYRALPVGDNRYVVLPPERLRRLLAVLEELYDPNASSVGITSAEAGLLGGLESAFETSTPLQWSGDLPLIQRGRALGLGPRSDSPAPPAVAPKELTVELRSYQQEGLNWLQHLSALGASGVLADDMGLGKTLQTIAHLATEVHSGRTTAPSLVIVPTSLVGNWQRECKRYAPFLKVVAVFGNKRQGSYGGIYHADVVVTSYPILLRDLAKFLEYEYHLIVLDEAQTIKNAGSQVSQAVKQLVGKHRLCLSGTPIENNLGELWSLFDFLMPGFLGDRAQFQTRFRFPIERDNDETRLLQLRYRVAPYILRRMKDTVAKELPPKTELVRPIELSGAQLELYEHIRVAAHSEVRTVIRQKGLTGSTITILDALMKLRQVCCDPRLVKAKSARGVTESAKLEFLLAFLKQQLAQGRRVLLFSQFTEMLALISAGLKEAGIAHLALTGATENRQQVCDRFESGAAHVFLISLKAGGTGLNLVSADTVIHYDPWWNPAAQAQATDRAYRIGQTKPVFVYNLIVAGSVEERMLRLQQRKRHLADTILGNSAGGSLSEADIEDLFQPIE
jgi:superfamily II DNA or RNA helicase